MAERGQGSERECSFLSGYVYQGFGFFFFFPKLSLCKVSLVSATSFLLCFIPTSSQCLSCLWPDSLPHTSACLCNHAFEQVSEGGTLQP